MSETTLQIGFYGGVGTVTGANFMLKSSKSTLLIDCGMLQGQKVCDDFNYQDFPYDPTSVDVLFITHAHLDHIGRVPKLVKDGFKGVIYSTPETKALTEIMLEDGVRIIAEEAQKCGMEVPLYGPDDVKNALNLWHIKPYHETFTVNDFEVYFKDAGHILGSAMVEFTHVDSGKKIVFTGDLGNSPAPLLRDTETIDDADYMVMESVYGDRNHESKEDRTLILKRVIEDTIANNGVLMIPAFSIERTQVLLYELNNLIESGAVPKLPVYLDSPLAIKVTELYRRSAKNFNNETQSVITGGDDIFNFPGFEETERVDDSKAILHVPNPKIIIAGAGMSHAGRIKHHEKQYLGDRNNTLLFVGYQAVGSLGRALQDGVKEVTIMGEKVKVKAKIETIHGYSAHKGMDDLIEFASHTAEKAKKIFVAMGEPKSSQFLAQRLRDYLGVDAIYPEAGQIVELG